MIRYLLRDEHFGGTLFDRKRLNHTFVSEEDIISQRLTINDEKVEQFKHISVSLKETSTHLLYAPIRLYFELTRACNLRCKTCFNSSAKPLSDEMSTADVMRTIEGIASDSVLDIRFSGGELTQRVDWTSILARSLELGLGTSVNTSGVYESQKTIYDLTSLGLDQVTISIDGSREFHDYIRGKGTFNRALDTLAQLHSANVPLRVDTVLTKGSATDMPKILDAVAPFIEEINFFYMRFSGRALGIKSQAMSYEELHLFDQTLERYKTQYPAVRILHGSRVMLDNSIAPEISTKRKLRMGGPDGFTRLNLLPNGDVWPGGYAPHIAPEFFLGNIKKENYTILPLWRDNPQLEQFRKYSLIIQEKCSSCPEKSIRCPGASVEMELYRDHSEDKHNPYCIY
ncbi:MAG TPA: radical SAM protein [Candidatus Nanoarchaeia archaeon]|nr:radical SAM protein [Candidatus Nanoarchaeia archaeon]